MSGEKRTPIQILQDEMRQNRQQLYSIQQQRDQLQQELNRVCNENAAQITGLRKELEQRDQKQAAVVGELKSDLRDMASRHNRQLTEQRNRLMKEMQEQETRTGQQIEDLRSWASNRLQEQRTEYRRISQEQQQQINSLKRDIENINRREDNREQRAREYLGDLELLIRATAENLPHERYTPGRLQKITRQLDAARIQLQEDVPAAAIATVQAAHFDLMDLEEEIHCLETEYEMTYRTVADAVGALFASVRQNRQIRLEEDATVQEANYWTNGDYQKLEDRIGTIKEKLEQNKQQLTTPQLQALLDDLETLTKEQEGLITDAVERIISSQLRAEMGDVVIEKLEQQGYRIKNNECGYAENDQRSAYMIKLSNVADTEVVAVISPHEKTYQNILSINTYNEDVNDETAKRRRNADILTALREGGLQLGETQCNEQSIEEFYDVGNIIKEGGKKLPKQVLQKAASLSPATPSSSPANPDTNS